MRWLLLVFVAAAAGALLWLWQSDETDRAARPDARVTPPNTAADTVPEAPERVLPVKNGIAVAPDEEMDPAQHIWIGRAWSAGNRAPAAGATVVLEDIGSGQAWSQPPAVATGSFFAKTPPFALLSKRLRLVLENADEERALLAVKLGKDGFTDVGRVYLRGSGAIRGRVEPKRVVSLTLRRFGALTLRPGTIASGRSDANGEFELDGIPHGTYALEGRDGDGRFYLAAPVVVPEDPPLVLRPLPSAPLEVFVRNTLGKPMATAHIEALPLDANSEREPLSPLVLLRTRLAVTDADGRAAFPQLLPGRYLLYVIASGTAYEFEHNHHKPATRLLHVLVDPTVQLRCIEAPPKPLPPLKRGLPIPHVSVEIQIQGRSSLPGREVSRTLVRKTDADGQVTIPRVGSFEMTATVIARTVMRQGELRHRLPRFPTHIVLPVGMRPAQLQDESPTGQREGPERRVRVVTPDGVPVKNARVYAEGSPRRKTNAKGVAAVGAALNENEGRIHRPRFASGDPGDVFGSRDEIELIWKRGLRIALRVRDHADGFPVAHDVAIQPRPSAWRMTAPGVFIAWWQPGRAGRLRVSAPGYSVWEGTPPDQDAEIDVALRAMPERLARLALEVAGTPGAWVHGEFTGRYEPDGRRRFHAMTGRGGRVTIDGLARGPWRILVERGGRHAVATIVLGAGRNPLSLNLNQQPKFRGTVIDDNKRRIEGARIVADGLPTVRTDRSGRFFLSSRPPRARVSAPGHASRAVDIEFFKKTSRIVIVLQRLGSIALPLAPPGTRPDFLEMSLYHHKTGPRGWRQHELGRTARYFKGRVRADGIPPGTILLRPLRGSLAAHATTITVKPGKQTRSPGIKVRGGGIIEGKITDGANPVAGRFVYANTRPARSNAQGEFRFVGLPAGRYTVWTRHQQPGNVRQNKSLRVHATSVVKVALLVVR